MTHRVARLLGILLIAGAAGAAPAAALEPFSAPARTDGIKFVSSTTKAGWKWQFFRNTAYPCSVSGYQTFAIGTRLGTSRRSPRPLWVRMRGGGVGFFSPDGKPRPSSANKVEDGAGRLRSVAVNNALNKRVNSLRSGFRNLSVSMCSHDLYSGGAQPDPFNPFRTASGRPRSVNGLVATKAAIQFAARRYRTTRTFLHGTSAGSFGAWGVAWSLQRQGIPVAGVVADSGVVNRQFEADQNGQGGRCARGSAAIRAIGARVHPVLANPGNQPDLLVSRGALTTPVFNVWNRDDANSCGTTKMACTRADRSVVVIGAMVCKMDRISRAIAALPARRRSRTMRVCVRAPKGRRGSCARHVVTGVGNVPNTARAFPADYNGVIVDWVRARLRDPLRALHTRLGRPGRVARSGRVRVRCKAAGAGPRRCAVSVRSHGRRIGSGSRSIAAGSRSTVVTLRLNRRGRSAVSRAGRRGLLVRVGAKVAESGTGRAGKDSRRARLRR